MQRLQQENRALNEEVKVLRDGQIGENITIFGV
jgi:cell division protein FtsB